MTISKLIYESTKDFPTYEIYGLTSQLRRASVSVAANIAEGHSRNTTGEYKHFIGIALGSVAELETLVILSEELKLNENADWTRLLNLIESERKMLFSLKNKLRY